MFRTAFATILFAATISSVALAGSLLEPDASDEYQLLREGVIEIEGREYIVIDDMLFPPDRINPRSLLPSVDLWPNGQLIFQFENGLSANRQQVFRNACALWERVSNVRCVQRNGQNDFVLVQAANVNQATVGVIGGQQVFQIFNWNNQFIVAHELAHAFGFLHEQSRSDRDRWVTILSQNIQPNAIHNFRKYPTVNRTMYDYESVMHYGPFDFTSNGQATISPSNLPQMGQRTSISFFDELDFKYAYGEHPTNRSIPVIDMVGSSFTQDMLAGMGFYSPMRRGYSVRVTSGPTNSWTRPITNCEFEHHVPEVVTQSVAAGTMVALETVVDLTTEDRVTYIFQKGNGPCQ